jgi:hypothetical protein
MVNLLRSGLTAVEMWSQSDRSQIAHELTQLRGICGTECGRIPKSSIALNRIACCFPGIDSALEHLRVRESLTLVFGCLTGSACLAGSSSIKDNFLMLRQRLHFGFKTGQ